MFQSLIGILIDFDAASAATKATNAAAVSIPDRDSNRFRCVLLTHCITAKRVSIPDRDSNRFRFSKRVRPTLLLRFNP